MLKKFTKIISMSMVIVMALSSFAFATGDKNVKQEPKNIITVEEFENTLKAEYAKYDIEYKLLDYNPNVTITRDMLNNELAKVKTFKNSIEVTPITPINTEEDTQGMIRPLAMYYDAVAGGLWKASDSYGWAYIQSEANVTVNGSNGDIVSVNSSSSYQLGGYLNFDGWTTTDMRVFKNQPSAGYVTMNVTGRLATSYTDTFTGMKHGYTSTVSKLVTAKAK